jgi:hypothetical protein
MPIGVDPQAAWFPILIILGVGIASTTIGALNQSTSFGQILLWLGIVEIILAIIISVFTYGNDIKF